MIFFCWVNGLKNLNLFRLNNLVLNNTFLNKNHFGCERARFVFYVKYFDVALIEIIKKIFRSKTTFNL